MVESKGFVTRTVFKMVLLRVVCWRPVRVVCAQPQEYRACAEAAHIPACIGSQPETRIPKPETRIPKPETLNPKPL